MTCYVPLVPAAEIKKVHGARPTIGDVVPFWAYRTTNLMTMSLHLYLVAWLVGVLCEPTPSTKAGAKTTRAGQGARKVTTSKPRSLA